jgi:hypothetical protein
LVPIIVLFASPLFTQHINREPRIADGSIRNVGFFGLARGKCGMVCRTGSMTWEVRRRNDKDGVQIGAFVSLFFAISAFLPVAVPILAGAPAHSGVPTDIIFVQAKQIRENASGMRFPEGSRIVRIAVNRYSIAGQPINLTDGFFAAADPAINFDASKVVFSGKKKNTEAWQIWEMQVDGAGKRQITNCADDCTRAAYLPDEEIVFTDSGDRAKGRFPYLAVVKLDGSQVRRITFGPGGWRLETVLRDGRILASASWPMTADADTATNRLLYTLRPDGTAVDALRCDHGGTASRGETAELQNGTIVFVKSSSVASATGELAEIQKGEVHEHPIGLVSERLGFPREMADGRLIVARQPKSGMRDDRKLDLYIFDLQKKLVGEKIYSDTHLNSLQPTPVLAHAVPKKFWSTLNSESKSGYFIALDSYASAEGVSGRISTAIATVRVWTLPADSAIEEVLGEAPVEKDGSFYVEVAANESVRFELLDSMGKVIRSERSWIWSRPGEQRGCTGCHGDKAVAPENRWPETLKRFDTPTRFGQRQSASRDAHAN